MTGLLYYGYDGFEDRFGEITVYTIDKERLKLSGVIIKILMNNLVTSFPNFKTFKKIGLRFTKFNYDSFPIASDILCDSIDDALCENENITFGNYMCMFTEGIDYAVIFRLERKIHSSRLSFLQESFDPDKDCVFVVRRSLLVEGYV
jgi:hypothetical protein